MSEAEAFARLHPSIRYLIQSVLKFPSLRPVQALTLEPVLNGRDVVVLAPTAGGKTEAAALPIMSRILSERLIPVSTLYICPLRALLNNQEPRLKRMAEAVGLRVGKWHGDVPAQERKTLVQEPPDILMITPESLEVLLISAADRAEALLSHVKLAIVDEVHAFAADPRGAHLVSVLERLQLRTGGHIQRLGLSATVGNPDAMGAWLQGSGATAPPIVVSPGGSRKPPTFRFRAGQSLLGAVQHIRELGEGQKRLVFVEGRARAEELARTLEQHRVRSWVHHSSVGRTRREAAEMAFETVPDAVLVATSSLELGIDIGDLDQIFQLDAPATVSSLAQRLGRTGRRPTTFPQMTFLAAGPEELLLAIVLTELYQEGWVEAIHPTNRNWTVLVHQLFANLLECGGLTRGQLIARIRPVPAFTGFQEAELQRLLTHLLRERWLDEVDGTLVLGEHGEKVFGGRNFFKLYAVFDSPEVLSVRVGHEEVGTLQTWFALQLVGARRTFRLAGRSWELVELDLPRGLLRAKPASEGAIPTWSGRPQLFGREVCERILMLLKSEHVPEGCDGLSTGWLTHARELFASIPVNQTLRPVVQAEGKVVWHTFAGARINGVLARLLELELGLPVSQSNLSLKTKGKLASVHEAVVRVQERLVEDDLPALDTWASFDTGKASSVLSSFQACLPEDAEQEFLQSIFLDVEGARRWAAEVEVG